MKFCIIGAGVSGICVGYFFKLMNLDFEIVEPSFKKFHNFNESIWSLKSPKFYRRFWQMTEYFQIEANMTV